MPRKKRRTKRRTSRHDILKIFGPAIAATLIGFIVAYQFGEPAPPKRMALAAGRADGAYFALAERYSEALAADGITVEVLETAGTVENLALLTSGSADAALVQSGVGDPGTQTNLLALGSLYLEPLWVFYRGPEVRRLSELAPGAMAVGAEGSGTRALATRLLDDNGIRDATHPRLALGGEDAVRALMAGEASVAFLVIAPESALVQKLLTTPDIRLLGFSRAAAMMNRHRFLSAAVLHEGVIDPAANIPPAPHTLLCAAATLVVRSDFHPALIDLLLNASGENVGKGNWIEQPGAFPSPRFVDFELAPEADDFYESGRPFLLRVLPFWAATLVNRLKIMLLPLLTLLLPLIKLFPPLYSWRIRRRINRWYKALQKLETEVAPQDKAKRIDALIEEIERIEDEVTKVRVPPSYGGSLYQLRFHTSIARDKLEALREQS